MPDPSKASAPSRRDRRIDMLRGMALMMIFINHIPGTVYESYTSRNFGFSDAAEGFVLISGISAALAYSAGLRARPLWPGVARIWGRAWVLYLVHLFVMAWVIGIAAGVERFTGNPEMMSQNNLQYLQSDLPGVLVGIPILTHQLGYVNILPLYAVLLLAAPGLILAASRWPGATLAGAIAVWVLAGLFRLDLPNFPTKGGWFFNPLAWQILFVLGILTGLAIRRGARFVAVRGWLVVFSAGYLLLSLAWLKIPALTEAGNAWLGWVSTQGVPFFIRDFDKTYVALPRLLHILSLAYLLSVWPLIRDLANSPIMAPFVLLGRQALPVFAFGTILSTAVQAAKTLTPESIIIDGVMIALGLALQLALAWARDRHRSVLRAAQAG